MNLKPLYTLGLIALGCPSFAQSPALRINVAKTTAKISPMLYGIMTEEINHCYDGGLYAELVQNRIFKDDPAMPVHWSAVEGQPGSASISLDRSQPYNDSLTVCLKLDAHAASAGNRAGIANEGFWGMRVDPNTTYKGSFYAKAAPGFTGSVTVSLESSEGKILAQAKVASLAAGWKKYPVVLKTGAGFTPSISNRLVISTQSPGTLWFNLVSLFPPTYNDRPNGNRIDIMQKLADLGPKFLRFPGGNYMEGNTMAQRYQWKKTIHDLSVRPGHPGTWKYRSSDGIGLMEYLEWTEDLKIEPVLAVFAGYTLNREYVQAGPQLQQYVDEALEQIEYVTGPVTSKWGAQRAADGHPKPFKLSYVEIGNEDFFDRSGSYDGRYAQFYDAIKKKYPNLQLIATTAVKGHVMDVLDDHFYRRPEDFMVDTHHYDTLARNAHKIFVGEWASRPAGAARTITPNMWATLGDACWMTGMERNSDVVVMAGYAPLFVNVNPGASQWPIDMIGFDAMSVYGSPSYYAQQLFYKNMGSHIVESAISNVPEIPYIPAPARQNANAPATPPAAAPQRMMPGLSYVVSKDEANGTVILKMVNITDKPQSVQLTIEGVNSVSPSGTAITLAGKADDTNTISDPVKLVPVTTKFSTAGKNFTYTFLPTSVTVLRLSAK